MNRKLVSITTLIVCQFLFNLLLLGNVATASTPLTLWIHPYRPAVELVKKFTPLARYLGDKIGQPVQVKISKTYQSHIVRVGEERMDIAYVGPAPFVAILQKYGSKTLLARLEVHGKPIFYGIIIARSDSPIRTLEELKGKRFAFGDHNSTMSYLLPRYLLLESGVKLNDLQRYKFLGTHNNVAINVLSGNYDAGGVKEEIYLQYKKRGLKVLAKSPPISEHLFVARHDLSKSTIEMLRRSLIELQDKTILLSINKRLTGMVPVKESDYESLQMILNRLEKIEEK